ncbi:hypothetical protein MATL_G00071080 [Megalops atlanticus]|uniref:TNFR-Cys domain-containing protein n=1 Tax=Megalops atlanticus TaxID=7932 RepID=A0A9D3Q652_MEGAT|nr:hypothetical protein MATL_G00071080 [Megalops atlanticus]
MCATHLTLLLACLTLPWVVCLGDKCNDKTHYRNDDLCCDLCPAGHFVKKDCTRIQKTICEKCPSGTYNAEATELFKCYTCMECQYARSECIPTRDAVCYCPPDSLCTTEECPTCKKKPTCGKGEQLQQTGEKCEPCPNSTYSDREGGNCTALTRCDQLGLDVVFPGNKTHNAICTQLTTAGPKEDGNLTQVVLATCLLCCVFTSLMVVVVVSVWTVKYRKQMRLIKSLKGSPVGVVEESQKFQLSEEEKGDKSLEEINLKTSLSFDLQEYGRSCGP